MHALCVFISHLHRCNKHVVNQAITLVVGYLTQCRRRILHLPAEQKQRMSRLYVIWKFNQSGLIGMIMVLMLSQWISMKLIQDLKTTQKLRMQVMTLINDCIVSRFNSLQRSP